VGFALYEYQGLDKTVQNIKQPKLTGTCDSTLQSKIDHLARMRLMILVFVYQKSQIMFQSSHARTGVIEHLIRFCSASFLPHF